MPNGAAGAYCSSIGAVTTFAEVSVVADSRTTTTARGWPKLRPMSGPFEEDEDGYCGFKRSNWIALLEAPQKKIKPL